MTIELDPQGDKITCPAFGLYSFPAEYSTMGHIVLDLTSLTYKPTTKSSDRPGNTKRHVPFAISEREQANPVHAPDMHEDEDEDDKPLVRPTTRRNRSKKDVIKLLIMETLHPWFLRDLLQLYQHEGERDRQSGETHPPLRNKQ